MFAHWRGLPGAGHVSPGRRRSDSSRHDNAPQDLSIASRTSLRLSVVALAVSLHPAVAAPVSRGDADLCSQAVAVSERRSTLPPGLLGAVALTEAGRFDSATGRSGPWPWTVHANGTGHFYASKADAVAAVQSFQAMGTQLIDVGCMQINLHFHPRAFASLDDAFDPATNVAYGAGFLLALFRQFGEWPGAVAAYHSQTPGVGEAYREQVMAVWPLAPRTDGGRARILFAQPPPRQADADRFTTGFAARVHTMQEDKLRLILSRTHPSPATSMQPEGER